MLISILWIYINKVVFIAATKQRTRSKEPWLLRTADFLAGQSGALKSRDSRLEYGPFRISWTHASFQEAHGDKDPIRSIEQKENIENMARLVTGRESLRKSGKVLLKLCDLVKSAEIAVPWFLVQACFGLYTEEQCLISLFNSDYFWSWFATRETLKLNM